MKKRIVLFLVFLGAAASVCVLAHGKQATAQKATTPAQPTTSGVTSAAKDSAKEQKASAPGAVIGPQADRLLRQMSDYLKGAKQFSFHADITYDDLLPSGQKLQLAASDDVLVRRPDCMYSDFQGETGGKRFWYDGKKITLYDSKHDVYATEQAPPDIDTLLEHLIKVFGFSPPLSDLVHSDPYAILTKNVRYGFHAGLTQVDGRRCHHLAFHEQKIDWQIWIEDGIQWVPRKLVITYKTLPGAPQFIAVLSRWDFTVPAPDSMFAANLPVDANRIAFKNTVTEANKAKGGNQ